MQNQVWLVTGTTSGLGEALVRELLKAGRSVIATTRNAKALQEKFNATYDVETLKRTLVVGLDITNPEQVKAAFAKGIEKFGRIDTVVNNAAFSILAEVEICPLEDAHELFEVLFWGPVVISKEAIRVFREVNPPGEGGHIINTSSYVGYCGMPSIGYYGAAKFALEGITQSIRKEVRPEWNIQATIVQPGGFKTALVGQMKTIPIHPAYDGDNSPAKMQRTMLGSLTESSYVGDVTNAAKAFIVLADKRQDLPLRVQFGSDSHAIVRHTAMKTISDSEKWESISCSTNVDGLDHKAFTEKLSASFN